MVLGRRSKKITQWPFANFIVNVNDLASILATIDGLVADPRAGLPEAVFVFVTTLTPLVNVDLLIQDDAGRTLLTWRDDAFYGPGWHLPGGVIRFQETAAERLRAVARLELGVDVESDPAPAAVHELIDAGRRERGHSIALLYRCRLLASLSEARRASSSPPRPDQWAWHEGCPQNLIAEHRVYQRFFHE
jgi:colanic acid biosynthesis protein WcaH